MSKLEAPQFGGQNGSNIGSNEMSSLSAGAGFCPKNDPHSSCIYAQHSQNRTTTKKNQIQYLFVHAPRGFFPGFPRSLSPSWWPLDDLWTSDLSLKKPAALRLSPSVAKVSVTRWAWEAVQQRPPPLFFHKHIWGGTLNIGYFTKKNY